MNDEEHAGMDGDRAGGINLMLVEDDEIDVETVRRALRSNGYSHPLWVAGDGEEALSMLRGGQVPLSRLVLVIDLNMPRMSGIDLLREIRADAALRALPVVVLTTSDDERDLSDAYALHVAGYLIKPVDYTAFVDLVARLESYWSASRLPGDR
jgi:CheY-like chemotaxis protein